MTNNRESLSVKYQAACERAKEQSKQDGGCVQHVNCTLDFDNQGLPCVDGFVVSDWSDGSTIISYENGDFL